MIDVHRGAAALLSSARREFAAAVERGAGGAAAHCQFADAIDELTRTAAAPLVSRSGVVVAALGGYGRRLLCLHSDVDLLVAFEAPIGPGAEADLKALLHALWDVGLSVGHQVRSRRDWCAIAREDPAFLLALTDARLIAGEDAILRGVREQVTDDLHARRAARLEAIRALIEARHARFNATLYHLEPDVKDAPGGLRDLWLARMLAQLARSPVEEDDALADAEEFLLRVRATLHLEAGRPANVLTHAMQSRTAARLCADAVGAEDPAGLLMERYFGHARLVARTLDRRRRELNRPSFSPGRILLGENLELLHNEIAFADPHRAASAPDSWLGIFETALAQNVPVAPSALTLIHTHVERFALAAADGRGRHGRRMLQLLHPRPGLYARLSEMHDCGLLVRIFPEFGAIAGRVVRDYHHRYTVDEHTLLAIRGLERLQARDDPRRERFASLLDGLDAPERLALALLYHDVGKCAGGDHAAHGVRLARQGLDRMAAGLGERLDVEFLIRHHLEMSRVAFRRDAEDPSVIRQFAQMVGTEERLRMLCLLTLVDIEAVGAGTLNAWKEDLLWRVYVDTYNELTRGYGDDLLDSAQDAVATLQALAPDDVDRHALGRFVSGLPRRYLARFEPEQIFDHARLWRTLETDELRIALRPKHDAWELVVVAKDRRCLFSNLAGVLAYLGMNVQRGSAMTTPDGRVLDIFEFTDAEGLLRVNPDGEAEIQRLFRDAIAGRQDVAKLLRRRESGALHRGSRRTVAPRVHVDEEHSRKYSIVEIVAEDRPGLLYRVSRVIARHGCDVDLVLINTEGSRAVDVYHLTKRRAKLGARAARRLAQDLVRMLEYEDEAD